MQVTMVQFNKETAMLNSCPMEIELISFQQKGLCRWARGDFGNGR